MARCPDDHHGPSLHVWAGMQVRLAGCGHVRDGFLTDFIDTEITSPGLSLAVVKAADTVTADGCTHASINQCCTD